METINYCIVLPEDVNTYAEEGTDRWYDLYTIISTILLNKVYNKEYSSVPIDICSTELYRDGSNLIFRYKAVPATAPTMSTFRHRHALIMDKGQMINGDE